MSAVMNPHRISGFAHIYCELYGSGAHQEAIRYALVARSMGHHHEHGFWLQVADLLQAGSAPTPQAEAA